MTDILRNVVQFFKSRRTTATFGPKITVDYGLWTYNEDLKSAMKKQWEKLREELDLHPECIKEREWLRYREGERKEELTVELEDVVIKLIGSYYPDPDYQPAKPEPIKSEQERGNEAVDQLIRSTTMIWAITHCSWRKFEALINFLRATREQ